MKGKTIDPREWGNVNLSSDNLDLEVQAAALRSFAHQKPKEKLSEYRRQASSRPRSNVRSQSPRFPAESRPVAQVAKSSYLGTALHNVGRGTEIHRHRGRNSPSPSESDPSDDSYSLLSEAEDSGPNEGSNQAPSSDQHQRRGKNRHGHNWKRRQSSSSHVSTVIKPILPKEYDSCVDT